MKFYGLAVSVAALVLLAFSPARAVGLDPAAETVVLTVSGEIGVTNSGDAAEFDFALLESLPVFTLHTTTPWTDGEQVFEGVLMRDLMNQVEAAGTVLQARALNDYMIEIPVNDFEETDVILAYRHNGERMTVRTKGPLWIVYPDDSGNPEAVHRMIWQLRTIEVVR